MNERLNLWALFSFMKSLSVGPSRPGLKTATQLFKEMKTYWPTDGITNNLLRAIY